MTRLTRLLTLAAGSALTATMLFFWVTPSDTRANWLTWFGIGIVGFSAIILALSAHRVLGTWRGLSVVLGLHLAAQGWLQWQWDLWSSSLVFVRNLNVVAGLIIIETFVALTISIALLLIFRDASVMAMAIAWVSYPLILVGMMQRYTSFAALSYIPEREGIALALPLCFLPLLFSAGLLAFGAHLLILIGKEIFARTV